MAEFIDFLSPKALEELTKANTLLLETVSNVNKVNTASKGMLTPSGANTAVKELTDQYKAQEKLIIKLEEVSQKASRTRKTETQLILDQAKSYQGLAAQKEKAIAQEEKVIAQQEKLGNAYERVKAKIASTLPVYNDLKTKTELGITLNSKQEKQLAMLEGRLIRYREVLNNVNKSYGNYSLEVGNYAKGNSNLAFSMAQISRELPNFGQSFQIGVLSLTNNVGALIDSIKQVKEQNALLKAEGKATSSVLSQITGALFSWQTALFLGIGLLSAYSKEIAEFTSELFAGNKQLKELNENQEAINNSRLTGRKDAQAEIAELKKYISVINNKKVSDAERQIAEEAIFKQYPFYIKNIKDLSIENGKYSKNVSELITALEKRKQVESATEKNVKNRQTLIDLREELKGLKEIEKQTKTNLDQAVARGANPQAIAGLSQVYAKYYGQRIEKEKIIQKYVDATYKNDILTYKLKGETIGLESKETNVAKDKLKLKREQQQYDENSMTALENQIKALKEMQGTVDASSYSYSILDFQVKLLENTLKAMKGEFNSNDVLIKPEQIIDADGVELEIDKVRKKVIELSKDLEKVLNDAYGYSNELGQSFSGSFDGLTKEQQDNFKQLAADYAEALDSGDAKTAESLKVRLDMYNAYGNTIIGYQQSFLNDFINGSGFENTFDILSGQIEGFGKNAKVTALAVMEAFQEMYNFISQMSQENFDAQRQRLEQEKEIALAFAGDSETARAEIEKQAEEKRKAIARREFQAKKQQAIFNIAIDTAQAIAATLGKTGFFGIPLTAIVAAIGAAQIAMVQSQEIPNFEKGGEHKGGLMLVNDGSGSNYKETIQTPDGKLYQPKERNVVMNAPKGTKIFTHDQWQKNLDSMLMSNNIDYAQPNVVVNGGGITDSQVNRIVDTIANKQELDLVLDKNGWNASVRKGHTIQTKLNNQVTFTRTTR